MVSVQRFAELCLRVRTPPLVAQRASVLTVAAAFTAEAFDHLDAPVQRVTGADVPMAYVGGCWRRRCCVHANMVSELQVCVQLGGRVVAAGTPAPTAAPRAA